MSAMFVSTMVHATVKVVSSLGPYALQILKSQDSSIGLTHIPERQPSLTRAHSVSVFCGLDLPAPPTYLNNQISFLHFTFFISRIPMAWVGLPTREQCELINTNFRWSTPLIRSFTLRFFTDSLVNKILMYDYDDGKLSNRRLFVDTLAIGLPRGTFPDGLCIDSEGGVWSARFVL